MLSSRHKLSLIKRMRLIGMAFYEPWPWPQQLAEKRVESPDFFEDMMAMNNAVMQEDRVFIQIASTRHLEQQL